MKFSNSVKLVIAFCFMAFMSSSTSAQSPGELIFNGDFNRMNTGVPFTSARANFPYIPAPWNESPPNGTGGATRLQTDTEIHMPDGFDTNIEQRADLPGFESSPVGGSFMGFNSGGGVVQEISFFGTSTDDSALPDSITIEFYYTEYNRKTQPGGDSPRPPSGSVNLRVAVGTIDNIIHNTPNLVATGGTPGTWEKRSVTFSTADANIIDSREIYELIFYTGGTNYNNYVFIDGVSVRPSGIVDVCVPTVGPRLN